MKQIPHPKPIEGGGSVTLVDYMGDDWRVVEAARVSFGHAARKGDEQDARLINYLMRRGHTSPFEQCEVAFMVDAPLFVARQMLRHRTANVNEVSRRYTSDERLPLRLWQVKGLRPQGNGPNKQGSNEQALMKLDANAAMLESVEAYKDLVASGACREQARMVLPQGMMTSFFFKQDLHNMLGFLEKRLHPDAQLEVRLVAQAMAGFVRELFPVVWEAFEEHRLHALKLSRSQREVLKSLLLTLHEDAQEAHADLLATI